MMRRTLRCMIPAASSSSTSIAAIRRRQQQQQRHHSQGQNNWRCAPTFNESNVLTETNASAAVRSGSSKSLWLCEARQVTLSDVKRDYISKRLLDKKTRFVVRQRLREGGATSNFFPLLFSQPIVLYSYEIEATRRPLHALKAPSGEEVPSQCRGGKTGKTRKGKSKITAPEKISSVPVRRVECSRAWRAVQRYLRRCLPNAPPLVNLRQQIYTTAPLPVVALQLPPECLDLGWVECKLHFRGKTKLTEMDSAEMQETVNKIVLWALRNGGSNQKGHQFCVAREANGKVVHIHDAVSVDGLRVFKGTLIRATFVSSGDDAEDVPSPTVVLPPSTAVLKTLAAGDYGAKKLRFLVEEFVRGFVFKERNVHSYKIADASGTTQASLWDATEETKLKVGCIYEVTDYRVRVFESHNGMRLVEMTVGKTSFNVVMSQQDEVTTGEEADDNGKAKSKESRKDVKKLRSKCGKEASAGEERKHQHQQIEKDEAKRIMKNTSDSGSLPHCTGKLTLKIDTKCTVATELSLWEEVKQHFGRGPYDPAMEERIARSVQGTPVVISTTLRHSIVRLVRFNMVATEVNLEPTLQHLIRELEPGQPYAVLVDYSVVPLQALHCCYDPRTRSWQDTSVTACSFMPSQRLEILELFRAKLESAMQPWGITVAPKPLLSKALSLLPAPQKVSPFAKKQTNDTSIVNDNSNGRLRSVAPNGSVPLRHPPPPSSPTTTAVVGIIASHASEEESSRVKQTTQAIGRYCRSTTVITVPDEQEAVRYLVQQLISAGTEELRDPNTAAVIVTNERETRLVRWMQAECLTRGILPLFVPPCASPKQQQLRCENIRLRLRTVFATDPLRGVDLQREVPAVAQRRVLLVGVDSCHTPTVSTGSVVGILCTAERNHLLPFFWKHERRGQEVELVSEHFEVLISRAMELYDGLDDVVVFQDGDVYSEMSAMQAHLPVGCGFTFACLHKRSDVRFVHEFRGEANTSGSKVAAGNVVKGTVVQALTIQRASEDPLLGNAVNSFYLQNHDCETSTARTVQYTLYCTSPTLDVSDVQQLSHVLAHAMATRATKLPMPTRCAHRLASIVERLIDAVPPLQCSMIPKPLNERLWFF
uniref:PIWI-like protein 1 n=1 Tax=Trypanosoma brucei TaxID=5691 RepID=Q6T6J9_9TRYP|nr:PIWI-like protein 1 [Trypanosoma brucei]